MALMDFRNIGASKNSPMVNAISSARRDFFGFLSSANFIFRLLGGFGLGASLTWALAGWTRPYKPQDARPNRDAGSKLDFVVLEVGGARRIVKNGEVLTIVRGDQLAVLSAALEETTAIPAILNVVGYTDSDHKDGNDQGVVIDTAHDLLPSWSESGRNEIFAITATTKKTLHGTVYFRLAEPVLNYAVLNVNGASRILRDGEPLAIDESDEVKVERVETNVEPVAEVIFQIDSNRIRFLRSDRVFAEIPIIFPDANKVRAGNAKEPIKKGLGKG